MPAHIELHLLTKLIHDGEMKVLIEEGITTDTFGQVEARIAFEAILNYYQDKDTRNIVPGWNWIDDNFASVDFPQPAKSRYTTRALCIEVKKHWLKRRLQKLLESCGESYDVDPFETLTELTQECKDLEITTHKSRDLILSDSMEELKREYIMAKETTGYLGIPYPVGWGYHTDGGKPKMVPRTGRQDHPLNEQTRGKQKGEFILLYGRPKCVVAGQRVMGIDGGLYPIEKAPSQIPTKKGQALTWGGCEVVKVGKRAAIRVTTQSGYVLEVGKDHPFLLPDFEFTATKNLRVGTYIGVARKLPEPPKPENALSGDEAELLGNLVGDGNYTRNEVQFTKGEPTVLDWLRGLGCWKQKSKDKYVPAALFKCDNRTIARFLSGYTDTDGRIQKNKIYWSTASKRLAHDVKHLLLRLGVIGSIHEATTNYGTIAYEIAVQAQEQHVILNDVLTLCNEPKRRALHKLATRSIRRKRHDDSIPYSKRLLDEILKAKGKKSWKYLWSGFFVRKLFRCTGRISRHLLRRLADHLDAPKLLAWADSDIRWEPVTSLTPLGKRNCWDISMRKGEPVFVVEDFVVHNSLKTWLLIDMAVEDYSYNHCRVLIFTKEMSPEQLRCRFVARMLCVDYMDFKNGCLPPEQEKEFFELVDYLKEEEERFGNMGKQSSLLITTGWTGKSNISGLASLEAKIDEFGPDVVYADAVYLMEVAKKSHQQVWQDIREISYGLKGIARDRMIPVVATSQANRRAEETKGSTLAEIAYGDSFGQACDVAIRIIKDEKEDGSVELACIISGGREIKLPGFLLDVEPAVKFQLKQIFESSRQIQAKFRAEEIAIAQEQEQAARQVKDERRLNARNFHDPR